MFIDKETVVTLSYQLFSLGESGTEEAGFVEERTADEPVEFLFGEGQLLSALESRLLKQTAGYQVSADLHPRDAFGTYREELVQWCDRDKLPRDLEIQMGMKFQTQGPDGDVISVFVKDIVDDQILLDGNHPLAGLHVRFEIKVLRVRKATDEELATKVIKQIYH